MTAGAICSSSARAACTDLVPVHQELVARANRSAMITMDESGGLAGRRVAGRRELAAPTCFHQSGSRGPRSAHRLSPQPASRRSLLALVGLQWLPMILTCHSSQASYGLGSRRPLSARLDQVIEIVQKARLGSTSCRRASSATLAGFAASYLSVGATFLNGTPTRRQPAPDLGVGRGERARPGGHAAYVWR